MTSYHTFSGLKRQKSYSFGGQKAEISVGRVMLPQKVLGEIPCLSLPSDSRCLLAGGSITLSSDGLPLYVSLFQISLCLSPIKTPVVGLRVHSKSRMISYQYS